MNNLTDTKPATQMTAVSINKQNLYIFITRSRNAAISLYEVQKRLHTISRRNGLCQTVFSIMW